MSWSGEERRSDGRRLNDLTDHEIEALRSVLANFVKLTPDEVRSMREIVEADSRAKWLWAGIRNVAVWLVAVIGGISLAWESFTTVIRALAGK